MRKIIKNITAVCVFTFCGLANASDQQNNQQTTQQAFDPSAQISLTQEQSDEIKAKLNEDKTKVAKLKLDNVKRDQAIQGCSKLFDSSYSDESVKKVKACLQSNGGMFPSDQQMTGAVPLDANNMPIQQKNSQIQVSNSAPLTNSTNSQSSNSSSVPVQKSTQATQPKQESMSDLMQNVLR